MERLRTTEPTGVRGRTGNRTTAGTCAACVGHLAELDFTLLPEADAVVVAEHLSECPDCRIFKEQLQTTQQVLTQRPAADFSETIRVARADVATGSPEDTLRALYRVAAALEVDDPDDLVQQTLVKALAIDQPLGSVDLIDALIAAWSADQGPLVDSLDTLDDLEPTEPDRDSESAELFYPRFYADGPDAGRFVDSPNAWGKLPRLTPEEELTADDLLAVVNAAIDDLPETEMRLLILVDIEGRALADAARALRLPTRRAAKALNDARIHIRGAIDQYLSSVRG